MAQLMSGEPRNQNIPGLDAILRGEIMRKDTLIAQLMNQNKMLMSAKERQDLEISSQGETLEVIRCLSKQFPCNNFVILIHTTGFVRFKIICLF